MITNIELENFKCFDSLSIKVSDLTIITGENGAGKSSIIQALLLLRQSHYDKNNDLRKSVKTDGDLANLGSAKDIRCSYSDSKDVRITLTDSTLDDDLTILIKDAVDTERNKACETSGNIEDALNNMSLFDDSFVYLYADRTEPKERYEIGLESNTDSRVGDKHGHHAAFLLQSALDKNMLMPLEGLQKADDKVITNVSAWINYIMDSHVSIIANDLKNNAVELEYSESDGSIGVTYSPMNMAFGYSYILPIVLALLTAPAGSLVVIENPEAHLHPSAQSRMGEMIALASQSGVQVILETHSDHLLNGVRIAAKKSKIEAGKVAIHYIYQVTQQQTRFDKSIILHDDGSLNEWPDGFFDEWEKTLKQLY